MANAFETSSKQQRDNHSLVGATIFVVMLTFTISSVYASIYCRGLYQDGAYHLFRMAEHDWFYLHNPPRMTVEAIRQAPVVLLRKLGGPSLVRLGQVFSLGMLILPVLLVAGCWFIAPKDYKVWTLLPVIHLLIGFSTMSFEAVGEAAIAAGYFWVLLFLLLFRTQRPTSQLLFLGLCGPAFQLGESTLLLVPILLLTIAFRARIVATWLERLFLSCAALMMIVIMIYQLQWVIHPRIPGEPSGALLGILTFEFLYFEGRINLPVVTAFVSIAALSVTFFFHHALPRIAGRYSTAVAVAFVIFALIMIGVAWQIDGSITPRGQSLARYNPIFATMALGTLMVLGVNHNPRNYSWAKVPTLAIVTALALTQMATDLAETTRWRHYIQDFEGLLARSKGLVEWSNTTITGDIARDNNWHLMTVDWVHPIMSIILSKDGDVRSILDYPPETMFRPIDLSDPQKLPAIRGVSFANYRRSFESSAKARENEK